MLHDNVLIENKYGCVIMHDNGAMIIVHFIDAQMAETSSARERQVYCAPSTLSNVLMVYVYMMWYVFSVLQIELF